ncbi:MAG: bis(5'-nucleosyl)-tetraphosphatase (symmetrical) YqeK [Oscillospiraceae bacterium]|nr:bis(5'-nucleosyl)-tetraphosphatase (symmetrical) YqeK [Oscillospiraceae bacterium]
MITHHFTGNIKSDVKSLLWAHGKDKTYDHVKAVAETSIVIAEQYGLDKEVCELGGYLHDISAVVSPDDMMAYAIQEKWHIDEAEKKFPFLLHQRISRVIAEEDFGVTDQRVLSAVQHHTTLKPDPSPYDMVVFVADKLAWDGCGEAPFYKDVKSALVQSLEAACLAYQKYIVSHKIILHPHKWFEESYHWLQSHPIIRSHP